MSYLTGPELGNVFDDPANPPQRTLAMDMKTLGKIPLLGLGTGLTRTIFSVVQLAYAYLGKASVRAREALFQRTNYQGFDDAGRYQYYDRMADMGAYNFFQGLKETCSFGFYQVVSDLGYAISCRSRRRRNDHRYD